MARQGPRPARRRRRPRRLLRLPGASAPADSSRSCSTKAGCTSSSSSRTRTRPIISDPKCATPASTASASPCSTADPDTVELPPYLAELMVSEDLGSAGATVGKDFVAKAFASLAALRRRRLSAGRPTTTGRRSPPRRRRRPGQRPRAHGRRMDAAVAGGSAAGRRRLDPRARRRRQHPRLARPARQGAAGPALVRRPVARRHPAAPRPRPAAAGRRTAGCSSRAWTSSAPWTSTPAGCSGRRTCPASARPTTTPSTSPAPTPAAPTTFPRRMGSISPTATVCVRLDPATGRQTASFSMPTFPGEKAPPTWDWVTLAGDALDRRRQPRLRRPHGQGRRGVRQQAPRRPRPQHRPAAAGR